MNPAEVFLSADDREHDWLFYSAYTFPENISNRQSGHDHERFVRSLLDDAEQVCGERVAPRLVNHDQAGQIPNGWIGATRRPGQVTNQIMWSNVVAHVLLWFDHQMANGQSKEGADTGVKYLERLIPIWTHYCRNHVCMGTGDWIESKDHPKEVKALGQTIISIFKHLASDITNCNDTHQLLSSSCVLLLPSSQSLPFHALSFAWTAR